MAVTKKRIPINYNIGMYPLTRRGEKKTMDKRIRLASDKLMEASLDIEKAFVTVGRIAQEYSVDSVEDMSELRRKMEIGGYYLAYDIQIILDYICSVKKQINELEQIINN